jgi:hypothetical protein
MRYNKNSLPFWESFETVGGLGMADIEALRHRLEQRGFATRYFETGREAADYLEGELRGCTIGIGGSVTVQELGLAERLAQHNTVYWHWKGADRKAANDAPVYLCSVNGLAETGEMVNIDGNGNRVASTFYGHESLYLIVGSNKIAPDLTGALWRARNVAAPKNARRLGCKTPCAVKGDRCYDCDSPERICRALGILWGKPTGIHYAEVILVGEPLGL